jgi:hypothetical protein
MGAVEIREELHKYIEIADKQFLKTLYQTAQSYIEQKKQDRLMVEAEADIKEGRVHSQSDVQKMIEGWTE